MKPRSALDAAARDIARVAGREHRDRLAAERATAAEREHADEDRELRRARMRAVHRAAPERRERVAEVYDAVEADVLRQRACAPPTAAAARLRRRPRERTRSAVVPDVERSRSRPI